jgi:hypothetical protein
MIHRTLTITATSKLMTGIVRCPSNSTDSLFQRIYTAGDTELWLFSSWGMSVYRKRTP